MTAEVGPKILNVDDNEAGRYAVTRVLQRHNFRVKEARSGTEALRMAAEEHPDLVLLDINLPDINGFEVCRRLKEAPDTSRIPVLHITASYPSGVDKARGLDCGADNYLVEPVEPEVLLATINSVLRARRAEEAARLMAGEWQATFDAISDGVALADADGQIRQCNESLLRILAMAREDLVGASCQALFSRLPAEHHPLPRAFESRRRETTEFEHNSRWLILTADPRLDEEGRVSGAVLILRDVTERRQLEEQFRESQKFETIGTLAAGVAHDFNNLLTSMMGNASLVLTDLPAGSPNHERLTDVVHAAERAADLTRQLLAYSGKGRHYMQKVDLSALTRSVQHLVEASVPKKVNLKLRLASRLPRINADTNQLQQVLLNLVSNAAEAIGEENGTVEIRTGMDSGESVYLEVRDTGCGMDAETKARMFDPFFTTKFTGRGLGLAAVAGIVRGHKASIQVKSSPGEGSTLRISFPAAEEVASIPTVQAAEAVGGTVLVVDDEEMVRRIAKASLETRGYNVLLAANGREAIEQAQRHPEIGLVLLDLTMPLMGGEEAIDEIVAARPGIQVLVSTGYDRRDAVAKFKDKRVAGYLLKPYTSRQLAERVRALLPTNAEGA